MGELTGDVLYSGIRPTQAFLRRYTGARAARAARLQQPAACVPGFAACMPRLVPQPGAAVVAVLRMHAACPCALQLAWACKLLTRMIGSPQPLGEC